jgi:hypothetical protein
MAMGMEKKEGEKVPVCDLIEPAYCNHQTIQIDTPSDGFKFCTLEAGQGCDYQSDILIKRV